MMLRFAMEHGTLSPYLLHRFPMEHGTSRSISISLVSVTALLVVLLPPPVWGDLPVHCLHRWVCLIIVHMAIYGNNH